MEWVPSRRGGGRGGGAGNPAAPTRWSKYHLVLLPSSRATKVLQVGLHLLLSSLQTLWDSSEVQIYVSWGWWQKWGVRDFEKISPCFAQPSERLLLRNTFFLKPFLVVHRPCGSPHLSSFSRLFLQLSTSANVASQFTTALLQLGKKPEAGLQPH